MFDEATNGMLFRITIIDKKGNTSNFDGIWRYSEEGSFLLLEKGDRNNCKILIPLKTIKEIMIYSVTERIDEQNAGN